MKLEEIINQDIKKAMMERATERLSAIRLIKSAIQVEKSTDGRDKLTDDEVIKIIQRLSKQSSESAEQYASAGRIDLVDTELLRVTIFKTYLPEQLSENEITEKVKGFITETGATSIKDMGKVMAMANKDFAGKADMKMVGGIVKSILS